MARRILLVSNPNARRAKEKSKKVMDAIARVGLDVTVFGTASINAIVSQRSKLRDDFDVTVVAGGDGTINFILPALVHTQTSLGILPLGTANNIARTLKIPLNLNAACEVLAVGTPKPIDVGEVNGHYFLTTASMGLSARITRALTRESKRRWGRLAYIIAAVKMALNAKPFSAELRLDGRTIQSTSVQIVVGNGLYYGTKMRVADDAEIDDHRLDVLSVEVSRWWELLRVVPSLKMGNHSKRDDVLTLRTNELEVTTTDPRKIDVDGELIASTPAQFRLLPNALRVLATGNSG